MRWYNSEVRHIIVRRMKCPSCNNLHIELPDCLVPHKQYAAEIIENEIDGVVSEEDYCVEDSPCNKTVNRWNQWLLNLNPMVLRSLFYMLKSFMQNFKQYFESDDILLFVRSFGAGWMTLISKSLLNSFYKRDSTKDGIAPELSGV